MGVPQVHTVPQCGAKETEYGGLCRDIATILEFLFDTPMASYSGGWRLIWRLNAGGAYGSNEFREVILDTYAHVTTAARREAAKTMGSVLSSAL